MVKNLHLSEFSFFFILFSSTRKSTSDTPKTTQKQTEVNSISGRLEFHRILRTHRNPIRHSSDIWTTAATFFAISWAIRTQVSIKWLSDFLLFLSNLDQLADTLDPFPSSIPPPPSVKAPTRLDQQHRISTMQFFRIVFSNSVLKK